MTERPEAAVGARWLTPVRSIWAIHGTVFVGLAIAPWERSTWALESILLVAAWIAMAGLDRRIGLSTASHLSVAVFLTLHAIGAHTTYSVSPLGEWLRGAFDLERNPYDRLVHFSFGLLLANPLREAMGKGIGLEGRVAWLAPVVVVLAFGGAYEIIEWAAARVVAPGVGIAFVGAQGDPWDAQKDGAAALTGALLALGAARSLGVRRRRAADQ